MNEIYGDVITEAQKFKGIIAHQVNTFGMMGAGVALALRQRVLTDEQYANYQQKCYTSTIIDGVNAHMGTVDFEQAPDGTWVANMFSQNPTPDPTGSLTNYEALSSCLEKVKGFARDNDLPVFLPGYVGCGIAGGDWNIVRTIINNTFYDNSVEVSIVYLDRRK